MSLKIVSSQLADFTGNFMHPTTDRSRAGVLLEKGKPSRALSAQGPTKERESSSVQKTSQNA